MRMMPAVFGMPSGFYARMRPSMQPGSMTYPEAVVLGVVQGVTEFLPVSSSGHLILVPRLFGWPDQGLAFDAAIHLGTLAALLVYFRGELRALASGALSPRIGLLLVLATIPGGLAGLLFDKLIEAHLRSALVVATSTALWAIVMAVADRRAPPPAAGGGGPPPRRSRGPAPATRRAPGPAPVPRTTRPGLTPTAGAVCGP